MALRTYGTKPKSFQIEENGEYYCMGSEVGNYLGYFRGTLYKKYPGMFRRSVTNEERKKLVKLGLNQYVPTSIVCLVRASEVEDIIKGNDHKYKTAPIHPNDPSQTPKKAKSKIPIPWVSATLPSTSRIDAIPQIASINPNKVHNMTVRTLPSRFHGTGSSTTAAQQETFIPIRSDEATERQGFRENLTWKKNANRESREDFIAVGTAAENIEIAQDPAQFQTSYSYDCRICLKNSNKFWEIFQTPNLPEKIMAIAFVQVQFGDGLPSVICFECRQLLDMFYDFKCLVEKSDAALRNALVSRMNINQDTLRKSSSQPDHTDYYQTQCQSQWQSLQNFNPIVSNVTRSKENLVAYKLDEESINIDDDSSEPEIIAMSKGAEILLENEGGPVSTMSDAAHQSMESECEKIKQEELFLPEESVVLEEEDNKAHDVTLSDDFKFELKNNSLLVGEEKRDGGAWAGKIETSFIGEMNLVRDEKPSIASLGQQKCPHCILSFATNVDLQTHITVHEEGNKLRYTCYWCEEQFSDIAKMINHVSNNHRTSNIHDKVDIDENERKENLDKDIPGSDDQRVVENKNEELSLSHIRTHPEYERAQTSSDHSKPLKNIRKSLSYQSDLFDSATNKPNEDHSSLEDLRCTQSHEPFARRGSLQSHIPTHSIPGSSGIEFLKPDTLKGHKHSENKEEIFGPSDDEDDDTEDESEPRDLTGTMKKETKCRPHRCAMCAKAFATPQSLASHMERHERVNESHMQFSCEICGKCFAQSGSLAAHMRTHIWVQTYGAQ